MTRYRLALLTLVVALSFTACGGSGDTSSGDGTTVPGATTDSDSDGDDGSGGARNSAGLDVCGLFTQADAEAVFGGTKMKGESATGNNTCSVVSDDPGDGASVVVMYQPRALADGTVEEIAKLAAAQLPGDTEGAVAAVDGIDGAFSLHKDAMTQVLIPHDGGIVTVTAMIVVGDNDNLASSIDLAKVVAGNL
jgi:hypothetical protein